MSNSSETLELIPGAVTVCDGDGVIVAMNTAAERAFAAEGGGALLGRSLLECHPEPARSKVVELLRERRVNVYTVERHGVRKLIYQAPWSRDGRFGGLIEISLEIPASMPHFVRDGS